MRGIYLKVDIMVIQYAQDHNEVDWEMRPNIGRMERLVLRV